MRDSNNGLFKNALWHEVYEILDSFCRWAEASKPEKWEADVNQLLFEERSPYRFTGHQLTKLTSDEERAEAAQASELVGKYAPAAEHMSKALTKFGARPEPDYENAAKEAACALETALNIANGKKQDVADGVRDFSNTYGVHSALIKSASQLFGYASDRDGVRHGKGPNPNASAANPVDFAEAKLVIVAASAWVNFIVAKAP